MCDEGVQVLAEALVSVKERMETWALLSSGDPSASAAYRNAAAEIELVLAGRYARGKPLRPVPSPPKAQGGPVRGDLGQVARRRLWWLLTGSAGAIVLGIGFVISRL